MLTRTLILSYRGADALNKTVDLQGGAELNLDELIPAGSNPLAIIFAMDVSQLKLLYLVSDKDITVKTNSNAVPVNTFTLAAGVPFVWGAGGAALRDTGGNLVNTDITSLQVVNAGEDDATLQVRSLYDPTA